MPIATNARSSEQRPSPEALLEAARPGGKSGRRLKIFVGALPRRQNLRHAETRGKAGKPGNRLSLSVPSKPSLLRRRPCSTALRSFRAKRLQYKDQILEEMDLDALIARRPPDRAGGRTWRNYWSPINDPPDIVAKSRSLPNTRSDGDLRSYLDSSSDGI